MVYAETFTTLFFFVNYRLRNNSWFLNENIVKDLDQVLHYKQETQKEKKKWKSFDHRELSKYDSQTQQSEAMITFQSLNRTHVKYNILTVKQERKAHSEQNSIKKTLIEWSRRDIYAFYYK